VKTLLLNEIVKDGISLAVLLEVRVVVILVKEQHTCALASTGLTTSTVARGIAAVGRYHAKGSPNLQKTLQLCEPVAQGHHPDGGIETRQENRGRVKIITQDGQKQKPTRTIEGPTRHLGDTGTHHPAFDKVRIVVARDRHTDGLKTEGSARPITDTKEPLAGIPLVAPDIARLCRRRPTSTKGWMEHGQYNP